ncbi:hypothetical protein, partial [Pseudomonas aeruginosa]
MSFVTEIKTFAALGSGVIGSGWIARRVLRPGLINGQRRHLRA